MISTRLRLVMLLVVALSLGLWLAWFLSPEQVIRRQVRATVEAFEREQLLGVAAALSRSYQDDWGLTYETILGHVQEAMSTFDDLEVAMEPPEIRVENDGARVRLRFVVSGAADGRRGYVVGSPGDPVTTTQLWRKEPVGWRVVTTEALDIPELRDELDGMRTTSLHVER